MVRGSHLSLDPRTIGVTDRSPPAQVSSVDFPARPDCYLCHIQNGTAVGQIAAPPGRIALP